MLPSLALDEAVSPHGGAAEWRSRIVRFNTNNKRAVSMARRSMRCERRLGNSHAFLAERRNTLQVMRLHSKEHPSPREGSLSLLDVCSSGWPSVQMDPALRVPCSS